MNLLKAIKSPLITEKTMRLAVENKYTFLVGQKANKELIKKAIEKLFKVKVESIRTIKIKGKKINVGKFRKQKKRLPDVKKAIVKLAEGQKIDVFETGGK